MNTTIVRAACPHDCPDTCAIRVTVEDGRAVRVQGDPDHPPTHGALKPPAGVRGYFTWPASF